MLYAERKEFLYDSEIFTRRDDALNRMFTKKIQHGIHGDL
jgi:hypothetical protein